jgi:hypothetical protein
MKKLFFCLLTIASLCSCSEKGKYMPINVDGTLFIVDTHTGDAYYRDYNYNDDVFKCYKYVSKSANSK